MGNRQVTPVTFTVRVNDDGSVEADPVGDMFGSDDFERMATAVTAVCVAEDAADAA